MFASSALASADQSAAYQAYYDVLKATVDTYGIKAHPWSGENWDLTPLHKGIYYAELIDFDNDGTSELLFVYSDGVHSFQEIIMVYSFTGSAVELFRGTAFQDYEGASYYSVMKGTDNTLYLKYSSIYLGISEEYYALKNGAWTKVFIRELVDNYYDDAPLEWYINGSKVSEQVYNSRTEESELGITSGRGLLSDTATVNAVLSALDAGRTAPPPTTTSAPVTDAAVVLIDSKATAFDVPPQNINGRLFVPLRAIFEALGADIEWDGSTQTVTAVKGDIVVTLTIGDTSPTVNGVVRTIDQPGVIVDGRTLAPLRFVAEAFGGSVDWVEAENTAYITN